MRGVYPAEYGQMPEGDTSIGSIFSELNRKKLWIFLPTLLAFLGAAVFVNVVKPKYTGESKVLLENRDNYFTRPDKEQRGNDPPLDAEAVQSQVQTIMSRDIAKTAIKKLDLASREEFDPVKKETSALKRVLALLGVAKDPLQSSPEERILENYYDKLLVFNVGKSRVISIEFSSRDPDLAYRGANLIADEYISFQRDAKKSTTQGASAWLAQAMEPMRAKVAEAEARVEAFRSENGLLVGASNATIATQQLGEMNTQMSNARSTQTELQSKARMIREALRSGRIFETSEVVNNELVRRLLEQRVTMKTQIALEERSLLPGHPRMKELNAQLNDLEGQIRLAAERTARTMENDAKVAGARVQSIQAEFEGQKRTASSANEHEVQLRALEREARALRENYEQYLAKYRDSLSRDADAASPADALHPVRLGLNRISGLAEEAALRLVAARAEAAFASAEDLARRAKLDARELQLLAQADALVGLTGHRHQAAWAVAGVDTRATPMLRETRTHETVAELLPPAEAEETLADYRATGLSLKRHPVALLRPQLDAFRVQPASVLNGYRHGQIARASGIVTHRQRPDTARGVVFVTLEDDTGSVNVIVWPAVAEAQRKPLLASTLMTVFGVWQREGEVRHLVAKTLVDHSALLAGLTSRSRNFR